MYNLIHTLADVSSRCESLKGMCERSELIPCIYIYNHSLLWLVQVCPHKGQSSKMRAHERVQVCFIRVKVQKETA